MPKYILMSTIELRLLWDSINKDNNMTQQHPTFHSFKEAAEKEELLCLGFTVVVSDSVTIFSEGNNENL